MVTILINAKIPNVSLIKTIQEIITIFRKISAEQVKEIQIGSQKIHRCLFDVIIVTNQVINIRIVSFYQKTETKIILLIITANLQIMNRKTDSKLISQKAVTKNTGWLRVISNYQNLIKILSLTVAQAEVL